MENCLFCEIISGQKPCEKVYEDDFIFVIKDLNPKAKTHLLILPKQHINNLNEVQEEDSALLGYMMVSLKNFAKEQGITSYKTVINTGAKSHQEIPHLHVHLLST